MTSSSCYQLPFLLLPFHLTYLEHLACLSFNNHCRITTASTEPIETLVNRMVIVRSKNKELCKRLDMLERMVQPMYVCMYTQTTARGPPGPMSAPDRDVYKKAEIIGSMSLSNDSLVHNILVIGTSINSDDYNALSAARFVAMRKMLALHKPFSTPDNKHISKAFLRSNSATASQGYVEEANVKIHSKIVTSLPATS